MGTPVRVTSIDPGMVETDFSRVRFRGDEERAKKIYERITPLVPEGRRRSYRMGGDPPPARQHTNHRVDHDRPGKLSNLPPPRLA